MEGIVEIDALVVGGALKIVGAMEDDVARLVGELRLVEHGGQRRAGPFADGAPALDAIVPGDLRA